MSVLLHDFTPLVSCFGFKDCRHFLFKFRPLVLIPLVLEFRVVDSGVLQQKIIKLRLDGTHRYVFTVSGLIGIIEVGPAIDHVCFAFIGPETPGSKSIHHCHQGCRSINHVSIHDLTLTGSAGLQKAHIPYQRPVACRRRRSLRPGSAVQPVFPLDAR